MPTEGRSLLDMGFTLHSSTIIEDDGIEAVDSDGPGSLTTTIKHYLREIVAARTGQLHLRPSATTTILVVIGESGTLLEQQFWRFFTQQFDTIIKANCTAQVIPSTQLVS